jgi:hypothetical protein
MPAKPCSTSFRTDASGRTNAENARLVCMVGDPYQPIPTALKASDWDAGVFGSRRSIPA